LNVRLSSIQVGKPCLIGEPGAQTKPWTSGYGKQRVLGPVLLRSLNLEGDGQADQRFHGGPDMAVLAYAAGHYPLWRVELDWPGLDHGAFAENFTVEGADEDSTCIGDLWEVGAAQLQVSQPRKPCANISRFWHRDDLLKRVESTGRIGWYLRVVREGRVEAGQEIRLLGRPHPEWTVALAMQARVNKSRDAETARRLAECPALGADFREKLLEVKARVP
jgi:MOSC domain-containing protein YiiM